jgi:uncharacterized protein (TIGR00297 family)
MLWIVGAICALVVSGLAYRKESLTLSGALAATVMGTIYFAAGHLFWFGILLVFFVSGSVLSKYKQSHKNELEQSYAKTGRRDAGQVLANGGLGMLLCLMNAIWPHPSWAYAYVGVMATVTADTWATEIGSLSRKLPRSILNGRRLPAGTSGGVSLLGTMAAAIGGAMIGVFAWLFEVISGPLDRSLPIWLLVGIIAGLVGAFTDSILGASLQLMYKCRVCDKDVEVLHHCGQETVKIRGSNLMNNDAVNIWSSILGGCAALVIAILMGL